VLGALAAILFSILQPTKYEARASISFTDTSRDVGIVGSVPVPSQQPDQLAAANATTIKRGEVLQRVQHALAGRLSVSQLRNDVQAQVDPQSNLVVVNATTGSATLSARVADAVASEAVAVANRNARSQYATAARQLRARFRSSAHGARAERAALADQISRLESLSVLATAAQVAEPARAPTSPASPVPAGAAVLGGILGLIIGLFVAAARDSLDRRLRDQDEIKELAGFPFIGQIGQSALGRMADAGPDSAHDASLESFRILRTSLERLDRNSSIKTIVVTSAVAEEGKTTVAASLASGIAAAGKSPLLIDCDLRRPSVAERVGISPAPGLTDYLTGSAEPQDVLQIVPQQGADSQNGAYAGVHTQPLACISAGSRHAHPAELLSDHERLATFLREVAEAYDTVIIDTSPLLPVADTLELLPHVDCVLLCVRASFTTRDQLVAAKEALSNFPDRPIGLIITGVTEDARSGYYPGYYYGDRPADRPRLQRHLLRR
jgi:capsular exopolysaccharide synthesis family protein